MWITFCSIPFQIQRHNPILHRRGRWGQRCQRQGIFWILWILWILWSLRALWSFRSLWSLWSLWGFRALWSFRSLWSLWGFRGLWGFWSFWGFRSLWGLWSFWGFRSLWILRVFRVFWISWGHNNLPINRCLIQLIRRNHKAAHAQNHRCAQHRRNCFLPSFSHGFFLLVNSALPRPASPCQATILVLFCLIREPKKAQAFFESKRFCP